MKKLLVYIIPALLIVIVSCSKTPKERVLTMRDVFPTQKNTDSTFVFDLDTVKNFESLTSVFCKNYYNKKVRYFIRGKNNDIPFSIRSIIVCTNAACGLIKFKNVLFIDYFTDSLFYHNRIKYNFNKVNVEKMLKKQFFNNGKNPEFASSPYTSLIFLEFSGEINSSKTSLKNKIDTISKSYYNFIISFNKQNIDSLKKQYPLKLILKEGIPFIDDNGNVTNFYNPPPPPTPIEIVE
ncbi:hypothetical protein H3Z83_00120 [Tenacibaculum sp. S7007]|uniref:Lipoprotein n=1 Tax=Tenacibaculum pelagium TaxID=2759527 RepID=A0A839AIB3_9FLAO|nr:hypothetical protein [Tenacibaculum pelagium]MBA6154932.1 hypothetical protein [Tenacibaculum pelagium]